MKCFGSSSTATTALLVSLAMSGSTNAFTTKAPSPRQNQMSLHSDATSDRRTMLSKGFGLLGISAALTGGPSEASASYSAYTNREKDWEARKASGDINISTARDLKAQLREIAPMNDEKSYKFCPNGPSSNVSPLMENKCGDKLAIPSVYGRTADITGNSIPGSAALASRYAPSSGSGLSAEIGGFPAYPKAK
eukprot:CAMPEP_0178942554 /NCGR_PEP_ID=MMETSP0789-20121207/2062_1 /TAXON_ID=3005 /ORGANISM="Rhizosolenia setigera, Strain CCMP 1694" /LENGTH=192 /DNA_ID=CAMNT_0020621983 /DNA_START=61 /DNA_END=639 /DNA_ORIENTATION=-